MIRLQSRHAVMKSFGLFLFLLFICWTPSDCSNILGLFPHPGYSHFMVYKPIFDGLFQKGNNVTIVRYFNASKTVGNYREIHLTGEPGVEVFDLSKIQPSRSFSMMYNEFWELANEGQIACKDFYDSTAVHEILDIHKKDPFDLVILEFFNTDCLLGLVHILNIPFIGVSSCALMPWHYDRVGLPDFPSFIPNEFVKFSEYMNFWERFVNFVVTKGTKLLYKYVEKLDNEIIKEKLHINVDVHEIAKKTSLIFVNQHYTLNGARPLPNKVVEIGGVHINNNTQPLPKEIENFLSSAKNGVIFVSWGSMVKGSSIPSSKLMSMITAFKMLPQKVLWKWESDDVPVTDKKFFFSQWMPQKDILCHPNVKLFWSHGGLLGVSEAVYCGKPLLVTPIYGDQFLNAKAAENRNVAQILSFEDINENNVLKTLKTLLSQSYAKNAEELSRIYKYRQTTPLETALWWIEYVISTKGNKLAFSPSSEMSWFSYYSLDVVGFLGAALCTTVAAVILLRRFYRTLISWKALWQHKDNATGHLKAA